MSIRGGLVDLAVRLRHPLLVASMNVKSHLTTRERLELYRLARRKGIRHVVEIGSYLGASALALAEGLAAAGADDALLHCIDTWENFGMSEGVRDTHAEFLANTSAHASRLRLWRGWSTEVAPQLLASLPAIDLLFVDGDHSYEGVLADWNTFGPALAPGAVLAFHDTAWAEGVQRVVEEHVKPRVVAQGGCPNLWWGRLPG